MATRILAHLGALGVDGRAALIVGGDVVYLGGRGTTAATMTPYDVSAVLLTDGSALAGTPPDDAERYVVSLRGAPGARAAALGPDGVIASAPGLLALVEGLTRTPWAEAEAAARAAGALVGAYPFPEA